MTADEKKLANLQKQYDAAMKNVRDTLQKQYGSGYDVEGLKEYTDAQQQLQDTLKANQEQMKKNIEQSRDFSIAWNGAVKQYQDDATNGAKIAQSAFSSFSSNVEKYFESLATHGKMSFGDLMNAVIQDIIKMEIKAATSSLFSMFGTAGGGTSGTAGSGVMGFLSGLFGPGKASGGYVPVGGYSLVGENGPELIKGPATVTNAPNTADMMGGGQTVHNYNISAIDSKSMAQMFQENRMTMYAMTEKARRELPMRTRT
jgi:lambda family phage tail tape measure protein